MTLTEIASHSSISTSITILPLRVGIDGETSISFRVKLRNDKIVDIITKTLRIEVRLKFLVYILARQILIALTRQVNA